jgi:hypothetical protein
VVRRESAKLLIVGSIPTRPLCQFGTANRTLNGTNMRELIEKRIFELLEDSPEGLPAYFDCPLKFYIKTKEEVMEQSDKELLEMFEAVIGFDG